MFSNSVEIWRNTIQVQTYNDVIIDSTHLVAGVRPTYLQKGERVRPCFNQFGDFSFLNPVDVIFLNFTSRTSLHSIMVGLL